MRIIVAGSGRLGVSVLEPLLDSHHEVVALAQNGRGVSPWQRRAKRVFAAALPATDAPIRHALRHNVPLLWWAQQDETELAQVREFNPDLIITCGFSVILKPTLLELPRIGCVNVHSSLLPQHRGPTPFTWIIWGKDTESGVTFHVTEPTIDTGAILDQVRFPVEENETAVTLYHKSCEFVRERVVAVLDRVAHDGLNGTPQNPEHATYDPKPDDDALRLDWTQPAEELHRRVRGAFPFFYTHFSYQGRKVRVIRTTFDAAPVSAAPATVLHRGRGIKVATGAGSLTIELALVGRRVPRPWPGIANAPRAGDRLEP